MDQGITSDLLGEVARITVDRTMYTDAAVFKAAYWFTDQYFLYLEPKTPDKLVIEIRGKTPIPVDDLKRACGDFCNSLIDFRVRQIVLAETRVVRETLVTTAFQEGLPKAGLPGVSSDESRLLAAQQS